MIIIQVFDDISSIKETKVYKNIFRSSSPRNIKHTLLIIDLDTVIYTYKKKRLYCLLAQHKKV